MNKLIVIPARGGSKGIKNKNIYPLLGKPLLYYTLDVVESAGLADTDTVVSTDSAKICELASVYNWVNVLRRPEEIASDTSSMESVLIHAINEMQKIKNVKYDNVITLQPTSPLRTKETLIRFVDEYQKNSSEFDSMISLHENRADFWHKVDGRYERLYKFAPRRRQERTPLYEENSAYYITNVNSLLKTNSILGNKTKGFIIPKEESVDVNEYVDLIIAASILESSNS